MVGSAGTGRTADVATTDGVVSLDVFDVKFLGGPGGEGGVDIGGEGGYGKASCSGSRNSESNLRLEDRR